MTSTATPTVGQFVWRFLTGRPLDGRRRTDATFLHAGRRPLVRHRVARWGYLAGWQRVAIRLAVPVFVVLVAWTYFFGSALPTVLRDLFWAGLPVWAIIVMDLIQRRQHRKTYHQPLVKWYAERFGVPVHIAATRIVVPRGHLEDEDLVSSIELPAGYDKTEPQQRALATATGKKLGLTDPGWEVDPIGVPTLLLRAAPPPPESVTYDDMIEHLHRATETSLFLGLGRRGKPVYLSWVDAAPWAGLSMRTGLGKSTACKLLAVQTLRFGGRVVIFDFAKGGDSHGEWCRDEQGALLPGVELYRTTEEAHDGLIAWDTERRRRSDASYARSGEVPQRTLVIIEESNISIDLLRDYWTTIREPGQPLRCPSIAALKALACAGRSTLINGILVAQKLSAAAAGGEAVRENLGVLLLAGVSKRTINNLIPDIRPVPRMSGHRGRITMVVGEEVTEVQVGQFSDLEARAWATSGVPQPELGSPSGGNALGVGFAQTDPTHPEGRPALSLVPAIVDPTEGLVTLPQACQEGIVAASIKTVTKFRERHPEEFPAPRHSDGPGRPYWYDPAELAAWDASRHREPVHSE